MPKTPKTPKTPQLVLPLELSVEMYTKLSIAYRLLNEVHRDLRFQTEKVDHHGMVPRPGAEPFATQVGEVVLGAAKIADEMRTHVTGKTGH